MRNGLKKTALGLVLVAPLSFAGSGTTAEHIEAATAAYKKLAKESSYQWTVTVLAIKEAKALKAGDDEAARKLAHEAMDLVEATRLQAKIESETWQMRVPK